MKSKRSKSPLRVRRAVYFASLLIALFLLSNYIAALLVDPNSDGFFFVSSAAVSLSFSATAIIYLTMIEKSKKSIAARLGLSLSGITLRNILLGVFVFVIILLLEVATGIISTITNIPISTNVQLLFAGAPMWFYVFAAVLAPLNEEMLFRGLMVPRVGILISAVLFAVPHVTYDSTFAVEVIAALIFGIIAGYVYKKTSSLYPSLIAHMLVNMLTIAGTLAMLA